MANMITLTKNGREAKVVSGDAVDREFRALGWTEKKTSDAKTTTSAAKEESPKKTETKSTTASGSTEASSTTKKQ